MSRAIRMLLEKGRITREQFDQATLKRAKCGETVGYHLIELGAITDEELLDFFVTNFPVPSWPRNRLESIPPDVISLVTPELARHLRILPLAANNQNLTLGLTDPSLTHVAEEAAFHTRRFISPIIISEADMDWALDNYYHVVKVAPSSGVETSETRPIQLVTHKKRQTANMRRMSRPSPPAAAVGSKKSKAFVITDSGWNLDSWAENNLDQQKNKQPDKPLEESPPSPSNLIEERLTDDKQTMKISAAEPEGTTLQPVPQSVTRSLAKQHARTDKKKKKNATELLEAIHGATNRDEVISSTLDYLLQFSARASFMVVQKNKIKGHDIKGEFTRRTAIQSYWVPLSSRSTFQKVADERKIHLGPLGDSTSDSVFAAALGGRPRRVLVIPVEIGKRIVGLLYADGLHAEMPPWNHLERLADVMGMNLARIILERDQN